MNKIWKVISWTFDWLGFFCDRVTIYADNQRLKNKIQGNLDKAVFTDRAWVCEDGIHEYDIAISTGPQWLTLDEREEHHEE